MQKMTKFNPARHGFKFDNSFINDLIPALDVRTGGLCGGMSYSSLDYFHAGIPVPAQPFRPANGTPLHTYLYERETCSVTGNLDKWAEVGFNPMGARNAEFFHWGISNKKGERIDELRHAIDAGRPVVLGLPGANGHGNHQVVAVGYDLGSLSSSGYYENLKIFLYDPNRPAKPCVLVPDMQRQVYRISDVHGGMEWQTYFVDAKYQAKQPPKLANASFPADGLVHALVLQCFTGGDDLRGGNDNLDVTIELKDETRQVHRKVNLGARWVPNYDESAEVVLNKPIKASLIKSVTLSTSFSGGAFGDNWDLNQLRVYMFGGGLFKLIARADTKRFSFDSPSLQIPVVFAAADQADRLRLTIETGGDDMRGGNDNLNLTILYRNGHEQLVQNVNACACWHNDTSHTVDVNLDHAVHPQEIAGVVLHTTFSGGWDGDNWNMHSLKVEAVGSELKQPLFSHGGKRFSHDDGTLRLTR